MRKTAIFKDKRDPIFSENFQYKNLSNTALQTTNLDVSAIDRKVLFPKHQSLIGKLSINLGILEMSNTEIIDWYILVK